MPRAILALRQYPVALLIAAVLFLCSLIIATQSMGIIRGGGGDDQGSGMGGTGKSGGFGDSGFGGTGGPVPYLGDSGQQELPDTDARDTDWPAPWLTREVETADIPDEMRPLIELQRNPPVDPFTQPTMPAAPESDTLRIQDLANDDRIAPETRRIIELANRQDSVEVEQPTLEIQATVPDMPPVIEVLVESLALQNSAQEGTRQESSGDELTTEIDEPQILTFPALADSEADQLEQSDSQQQSGQATEALRRDTPERISRPELPPFQRMRPAVDRTSITPPRPQPMRI